VFQFLIYFWNNTLVDWSPDPEADRNNTLIWIGYKSFESANEWATDTHTHTHTNLLVRTSDRRSSAKLVPTFANSGCRVVNAADFPAINLGFLDGSHSFSIQVAPQFSLLLRKSGSTRNRTTFVKTVQLDTSATSKFRVQELLEPHAWKSVHYSQIMSQNCFKSLRITWGPKGNLKQSRQTHFLQKSCSIEILYMGHSFCMKPQVRNIHTTITCNFLQIVIILDVETYEVVKSVSHTWFSHWH
jgi:hypothetical protein